VHYLIDGLIVRLLSTDTSVRFVLLVQDVSTMAAMLQTTRGSIRPTVSNLAYVNDRYQILTEAFLRDRSLCDHRRYSDLSQRCSWRKKLPVEYHSQIDIVARPWMFDRCRVC
jgi:hypothetical protein